MTSIRVKSIKDLSNGCLNKLSLGTLKLGHLSANYVFIRVSMSNFRNSTDLEPGGSRHVPGLVLVRPDVHVRVEADLGDVAGLGVDHLTRVEVDAKEVGGAEDRGGVFV